MSVPIIEIAIYSLLVEVIKKVKDDLKAQALGQQAKSVLDDIFENFPAAELADAKEFFYKRNIQIIQGYPRVPHDLPCIAIILGSKRETTVPLGEAMGPNLAYPDYGIMTKEIGSIWHGSWSLQSWGGRGNSHLYLDYLLEYVLTVRRTSFEEMGLSDVMYGAGDVQIKPDLYPEPVYARERTISGDYEVVITPDEMLLRLINTTAAIDDPVYIEGIPVGSKE